MDLISDDYGKPLNENRINLINTYSENEIRENLHRPTIIEPNTVGSFIWGCSQEYYGDINKSCSPLCIGSLNGHETDCQYSIWIYNQNKSLKNILKVSTNKAYIFVNNDWKGFTRTELKELKNAGIEFSTIITTMNSQHKILIPMTSDLPVIEEVVEIQRETNYWGLLFLVLIILLILLKMYY